MGGTTRGAHQGRDFRGFFPDHASELRRGRRNLLAVDGRCRARRSGDACHLLRRSCSYTESQKSYLREHKTSELDHGIAPLLNCVATIALSVEPSPQSTSQVDLRGQGPPLPSIDEPLQRLGPVAALPSLLVQLGAKPAQVFDGTGFDPSSVTPETRGPFSAVTKLLVRAADLTGRPDIGFLLGSVHDHRALGLGGQVMEKAATLREALSDFVGIQLSYSRGATVYLCKLGDDFALGYGIYHHPSLGGRQIYDLTLAVGVNMIRSLTNGRAEPSEVHFNIKHPDEADRYRKFYRSPLLFDQDHSCIVINAHTLETPIPTADNGGRLRLLDQIRGLTRGKMGDLSARLRHLIRPRLMTGRCDIRSISRDLELQPRTLSRYLSKDSQTFGQIRDDVRFTIARELLALTDLSVASIGDALLYSSHSAFDHAFRRWTGVAPSEWRRMEATRRVPP